MRPGGGGVGYLKVPSNTELNGRIEQIATVVESTLVLLRPEWHCCAGSVPCTQAAEKSEGGEEDEKQIESEARMSGVGKSG
jgi:hypothetical protein